MVDFYASTAYYRKHWNGVRALVDGQFISSRDIDANPDKPILVASYGDLRLAVLHRKNIIFAEHGTGLTYNVNHHGYVGSTKFREHVGLRLVPNKFAAGKEKKYNPELNVKVIGVPYLDFWAKRTYRTRNARPLLVLSTHWDCQVCPETRSAFEYYKFAIAQANFAFNIALHAHPRIATKVSMFARANGIRFIRSFEDVLEQADAYAVDNSSTLFEFAATGKPVMVLNGPMYRRDVQHEFNPRFWSHADIGVNVWRPQDLERKIVETFADVPVQREKRESVVSETTPFLGSSTRRASDAIKEYVATL